MSKGKSFKIGRDSGDGRFKSVEDARKDKKNSQVEHVPKKGYGTEGRGKKKS